MSTPLICFRDLQRDNFTFVHVLSVCILPYSALCFAELNVTGNHMCWQYGKGFKYIFCTGICLSTRRLLLKQVVFIQLLAGTWELDWNKLLQTPLSLTPEHLWKQLSSRSEFHEAPSLLSEHDTTVVTMLSEMFQSVTPTPLHQHL
jgi:hypothetical protein